MLISIKTKESPRLWRIPIPFHFAVNLFLRKGLILSIARLAKQDKASKNHVEEAESTAHARNQDHDVSIEALEKWLESVDLAELRHSIHELKHYKGMALVDIATGDGDMIKIVI